MDRKRIAWHIDCYIEVRASETDYFSTTKMNKTILCLTIAMISGAGAAFAIPTTLGVDFRSAPWQLPAGKTTYTTGNVTDTAAVPLGSTLTSSSTAGIGIKSPTALLGTFDILNVVFSLGSGTGLTGAWVTNLFSGTLETGTLVLNTTKGFESFLFSGLQSSSQNPLGDVYVNFGGAYNVVSAQFYSSNPLSIVGVKDYSVAGFTSVPDGGTTLALLGIGLITLTIFRRKVVAV